MEPRLIARELDPEEQGLRVQWIPPSKLASFFKDQTIKDGETMTAWLLHLTHQVEKNDRSNPFADVDRANALLFPPETGTSQQ